MYKFEQFHQSTTIQKRIINEKNFTYRHILTTINKFLISRRKILDIGCGAGTISLYLASKGHHVLGIDISQSAVNAANKSAKILRLKNISFERMNFPYELPTDKYDFIICSEVIEHIQDDNLALKKIFSLLKRGGVAFISTPSKNAPLHKLGLVKKFDEKVGHLRRYTLEELVEKTRACGFKILETKKIEGIVRNFLFLNPIAGKFVKLIKFFISEIVTYADNISLKLFGESDIFIVIKRQE